MNKTQIVAAFAEKAGITKIDASKFFNALMGVMAMEFEQNNIPVEIFSVHPGPTTTDLNGNMALPGFHTIDTVGEKFAKLINDGQSHNGEFIELYPIVKED